MVWLRNKITDLSVCVSEERTIFCFKTESFFKRVSPQTHPGCGHLTLKTSRKSPPFTVYIDLKQSENLGDQHLKNMGFHIFFIFFLARLE